MNDFQTGLRWYVIRTKSHNEERAQSYLKCHGIDTFLPWMESSYINKVYKVQPLFPNYIFARFDLNESYPLIKWGRGIKTIIGFGNYPTPLADEIITILKDRTNDKNVAKKAYQLNANDHIRIRSGPLKDLLGIFDRWISESGRVRILLNLVGYQPYVDLHYSQVEKLS